MNGGGGGGGGGAGAWKRDFGLLEGERLFWGELDEDEHMGGITSDMLLLVVLESSAPAELLVDELDDMLLRELGEIDPICR